MRAFALTALLILGVVSVGFSNADVSVTQYDSEDPVTLGGTITYAIVVMNNGPDPSGNIALSDTLPANVTFVSANTPDDWSCNTPQKDTAGGLNCSSGSGLNAGQNASFTVVVKPTAMGIVTNTVTVASSEPDPNMENNSKSEETTVTTALQPHP